MGRNLGPVLRIAWRDALRNRWRSVLIVALVAIPISGLTLGAVMFATGAPTPEQYATGEMGRTDAVVYNTNPDQVADLMANLPDGSEEATVRSVFVRSVVAGGVVRGNLETVLGATDVLDGRYALTEGRLPTGDGEVALSPSMMEMFQVDVGERFVLDDPAFEAEVVGVAVRPESLSNEFGLLDPAGMDTLVASLGDGEPYDITYVATTGDPTLLPEIIQPLPFSTRANVSALASIGGLIPYNMVVTLVVVALIETALVVSAAFAVGARRQLRNLGLIGAAGGSPRHVRSVVLSAGLVLGMLGSLVGIALGVVGGLALYPRMESILNRFVGPLTIPVDGVVLALVLGTIAALVAAWLPARSAAKISVLDALATRTPPPRSPMRTAGVGVIAMIAGGAMLAFGTVSASVALLTGGLVLMLGGVLLIIPIAVSRVERVATRLPVVMRIAGRDAGRHARRTGAAVAAATLALGLPIAISVLTLSEEVAQEPFAPMSPHHLQVDAAADGGESATNIMDAIAQVVTVEASSTVVDAVTDPTRFAIGGEPESLYVQGGPDAEGPAASGGAISIGSEDLLKVVGAERFSDDLAAGKVVVIGKGIVVDGEVPVTVPPALGAGVDAEWPELRLPAVETGGPLYPSVAVAMVSPERAAELGLMPGEWVGGVILATEVMTGDTLEEAKVAAASAGGGLWSRADSMPEGGTFRTFALIVAMAVALATIGVAVALVAVETRRDQAVLAAVGADPGTRRQVVAATAVITAVLAGLLAFPAGFLPVTVVQMARDEGIPVVIPWLPVFAVVVVVPLLAGLGASVATRTPSSGKMLKPGST